MFQIMPYTVVRGDFNVSFAQQRWTTEDSKTRRYCYSHHQVLKVKQVGKIKSFDSKKANRNILSIILPDFAVKKILSFHHQWCHVEVSLRLINSGLLKSSMQRPDREMTVKDFTESLKNNMLINFSIANGNELRTYEIGKKDGDVCIVIENENVRLLDNEWIADPMGKVSTKVHGIPKLEDALRYVRILELLLHHFKHTGEMKGPFIPKKANLSRTDYEVLMITLKHYAKTIMGENIYWKIDPIRRRRVERLKQEVVEPIWKTMRITSEVKIPDLDILRKNTYTVEEKIRHPDPTEKFRSEAIARFETRYMSAEDFDAGDHLGRKNLHIMEIEEVETFNMTETPTKLDMKLAEREDRKREKGIRRGIYFKLPKKEKEGKEADKEKGGKDAAAKSKPVDRKKKRASVYTPTQGYKPPIQKVKNIEITTTDKGVNYVNQNPHRISTTTGKYTEEVKTTVHHRNWRDQLKKSKQEEWQDTANLKMKEILATVEHYNKAELGSRRLKKVNEMWSMRDYRKPKQKFRVFGSFYVDHAPAMRKIYSKKNEYNEKIEPVLQNKYNLRSLQTLLYLMGFRKGVTLLNYKEFGAAISFIVLNKKIPPLGKTDEKTRFMKSDRKLLRMVLRLLI